MTCSFVSSWMAAVPASVLAPVFNKSCHLLALFDTASVLEIIWTVVCCTCLLPARMLFEIPLTKHQILNVVIHVVIICVMQFITDFNFMWFVGLDYVSHIFCGRRQALRRKDRDMRPPPWPIPSGAKHGWVVALRLPKILSRPTMLCLTMSCRKSIQTRYLLVSMQYYIHALILTNYYDHAISESFESVYWWRAGWSG
jgi:hypothetical protein